MIDSLNGETRHQCLIGLDSAILPEYLAPRKAIDMGCPDVDNRSRLKRFDGLNGNLKITGLHRYFGACLMDTRRATVIRVEDAATFIIRPNMVVKLADVKPPLGGTLEAEKAKAKLEGLVLRRKVEFETLEWDRLGRSIAIVKVDGTDVNEEMKTYIKSLGQTA